METKACSNLCLKGIQKKKKRKVLLSSHIGIESNSSVLDAYKACDYNVDIHCESLKPDDVLLLVG